MPVGIAAGVYLNQYGAGSRFAPIVRFVSNVMTGVPSVFIGVFVYSLLSRAAATAPSPAPSRSAF